jgi:hypothetical protein
MGGIMSHNSKKNPLNSNPSMRYKLFQRQNKKNNHQIDNIIHESQNKDIKVSIPQQTSMSTKGESLLRAASPYEFKTKQRPFEYTYWVNSLQFPLLQTDIVDPLYNPSGTKTSFTILVYNVPSRQALLLNFFRVSVHYRDPTVVGLFQPVQITSNRISMENYFSYNLNATSNGLYEYSGKNATLSGGFDNSFGFEEINQNVLENGDSSTTWYIPENNAISFEYRLTLDPATLFPATKVGDAMMTITTKGHLISMSEYSTIQKLKR